ncbi:MAG: NAD(P)H-binding protein [Pleurocapsa minor GSE-CHR-MK-17-07R]|nr:NAD(P)H-binding protein [Pleurocapsa minor GSE-CHR-MK 17-07R]
METILVIGGTGRLGRPVVRALLGAGYRVRLLSRGASLPPGLAHDNLTHVRGDLSQTSALAQAVEGVDAVYMSMPDTGDPKAPFIPEQHGVEAVLRLAPKQALLIKLSEIDAHETPRFHDLTLKFRAEERIRQSGHPFIIFRPTWFMDSFPLALTQQGRVFTVGRQPHPLYWIAADDFAAQVVRALKQRPLTLNKTFNIQGPEALTFSEAARRYVNALPEKLPVTRLPLWLYRLMGLFDARQRANYELMAHYNSRREQFVSAETWELLGKPTTTIEQFARQWHTRQPEAARP